MPPNRDPIIAFCWLAFFVFWIVASFFTKRTAERVGLWSGWWIWIAIAAFMIWRRRALPFSGGAVLWQATPALRIVADAITVIGLFIAFWARTVLGTNWSSNVVFKERHELIERGPYRFVRHPIYSGVLLMVLGTVILWGRIVGMILFAASIAGLSAKAWREERLLTKHFPDTYSRYRQRVTAMLVPFVI